jgi:predicted nucleic acid-binding protein
VEALALIPDTTSPSLSGAGANFPHAEPSAQDMVSDDQPGAERRIAFVDSSALVALADAGDTSHAAAVAAYQDLVATGYRLFTTDHMIVEAFDLLRHGPGLEVARRWLRACNLAVCHIEERDVAQAKQRVLGSADSDAIGLTDAISLAVMDRLGITDVFAVDQTVLEAIA